ncbi:sigma-70 family RNA polymerase sigma factor [Streptomyces sp. NPDC051561]|uniref:sigma-70 family RNA polymerase sigma factor n=1 Tax=Streptomyces sp. NPDC051561 TaxID=3365658 RepID=UPI0037AB9CE8
MSDDDVLGNTGPQPGPGAQHVYEPLDLPLDFEGFYLGHQEFFHAYAEIHLGSRPAAEEVVHDVSQEILDGWQQLLTEGDLEQLTLAVLHRHVSRRLEKEGRNPSFLINGPIAQALKGIRTTLEITEGSTGLYEAILALPSRQYKVIVLRHLLGYRTAQIARFMSLDERTVDYHGRKGKERLRIQLGLPEAPRAKKEEDKA